LRKASVGKGFYRVDIEENELIKAINQDAASSGFSHFSPLNQKFRPRQKCRNPAKTSPE
jgi:hypothetical protein